MNIVEVLDLYNEVVSDLKIQAKYTENGYDVSNLKNLRKAIRRLSTIPDLQEEMGGIINEHQIFKSNNDTIHISTNDKNTLEEYLLYLRNGIEFMTNKFYQTHKELNDDSAIQVKLPDDIKDFDGLEKVSADLKRAISIPVYDKGINGYVEIVTAESGSIWLWVLLGTTTAVSVIARLCYAAAIIRKKNAEAKLFEEHAKSIGLKNQALADIVDAQKKNINATIEYEAEQIADKNYDSKEPELIGRLKMSIATFADLIDRGTRILPNPKSNIDDIKELFPDWNNLNLIESSNKLLENSQGEIDKNNDEI